MNRVQATGRETAILAGGCFWCLEAVFEQLEGVEEIVSGYIGGSIENPGYQQVCDGDTGHAEAVKIVFDPGRIAYRDLLDVFFAIHDPTTPDRQGNDVGTQYRSVVFYLSDEQRRIAADTIRTLQKENAWGAPIVTEVTAAGPFYPAEDYHQEYFRRNGHQPYCQMVVAPKVAKSRKLFASRLKSTAR